MKRKLLILLLMMVVTSMFALPANALGEPAVSFHFVTAQDNATANDRLLYYLYRQMGYNIYFDSLSLKTACETANNGDADGVASVTADVIGNYQNLVIVPETLSYTDFEAYAIAGKDYAIRSWADLSGYRVGTLTQKMYLHNHLPTDIASLNQYDSMAKLGNALVLGQIDVLVTTRGARQMLDLPSEAKYLATLDRIATYNVLHKKHVRLIPALSETLRNMKADGTYDAILSNEYKTHESKKVLHLSSFGPGDMWDIDLQAAMLSIFDQTSDVIYNGISLDSLRYVSDEEMIRHALSNIRTSTMDRLPDLVIVSDNTALHFVREYAHHLFADTPIIYCGVNYTDAEFEALEHSGIYGLAENALMIDNIRLIEQLFPTAKEVFCINDYTLAGRTYHDILEQDMAAYQGNIKIIHNTSFDFTDLIDEIHALPNDMPVLIGTFSSSRNAGPETRQYISRKICEAANGPVISATSMGNGELGCIRNSATLEGRAITMIALDILKGDDPSLLYYAPPEDFVKTQFDFNLLNAYQLSERSLPTKSEIINRPADFRRDNPAAFHLFVFATILLAVIALLAVQTAIVSSRKNKALREAQRSLVSLSELQQAHRELSELAERLDFAIDSANGCVWEVDLDAHLMHFGENLKRILEFDYKSPVSANLFGQYYNALQVEGVLFDGKAFAEQMRQNTQFYNTATLKLPSGKHIHISVHARAKKDADGHSHKIFGLIIDDTAQIEALTEALEVSTRIMDRIDEQIYVSDLDTDEILFANKTILDFFGMTEFAGLKCYEAFMGRCERCEVCSKNSNKLLSGEAYMWELTHPTKGMHSRHIDKVIRWVDGRDVVLHVLVDITDIRNTELALMQQYEQQKLLADVANRLISPGDFEQHLKDALASIGDAFRCDRVMLAHADARNNTLLPAYEWVGPKAQNQLLRSKETIQPVSEKLFELFDDAKERTIFLHAEDMMRIFNDDSGINTAMMSAFGNAGTIQGVLSVGFEKPHQWSEHDVRLMRLLCVTVALHINRNAISKSLVEAKEAAEQANVAKSQFLSTMSHEIRTPLNGIIGFVQVLKQKDTSQEVRQRLDRITTASEHLRSIINDVLDMSKIESGKMMLDCQPFSVPKLLDEVAQLIAQRAQDATLSFACRFEGTEQLHLVGDKLALKQVLINLLGNAVKFSKREGQVFFTARAAANANTDMCTLFIEVADNGIGISPEQQERIFHPFEQSNRQQTSQYGGTGLGLAISQRLIGLMQSEIKVESQLDQGSRFYFAIALPISHAMPTETTEPIVTHADFSNKHFLIAEDIEINRQILIELLSDTNASIDTAPDGQQAVTMYEADPERYAVILMDIQMPVMNGLEAAKLIRSKDHLRQTPVPIIALTANAFKEDVDACLQAGMVDHIAKPINYQELIKTLSRYI